MFSACILAEQGVGPHAALHNPLAPSIKLVSVSAAPPMLLYPPQQIWPDVIIYLIKRDFSSLNIPKGFLGLGTYSAMAASCIKELQSPLLSLLLVMLVPFSAAQPGAMGTYWGWWGPGWCSGEQPRPQGSKH